VAFGGRILKKDEKTAKYVNSPESEIYHKSNELYGIYFAKQAIVKADRCFLVEDIPMWYLCTRRVLRM
jgi:DNA primase